jgi:uncharacterized membrane protein
VLSRFSSLQVFAIQIFLSSCLFFALTGGAFVIGWENLRPYRDLHRFIVIALMIGGACLAWYLHVKDQMTFRELEPARSIRKFFEAPPAVSLTILGSIFFATQFMSQLSMHAGLETSLWDLGLYDQMIWNTGHGHFMESSIRGGIHVFSEHFKAMFIFLSPLYWLVDDTSILFAVTTALHTTVIVTTYLITRALSRSHQTALILAIAVFFYQPFVNGINFLFHTQMMADPLILLGFYCALRKRVLWALVFFVLAFTCKESVPVDVFGISLFFIFRKEKIGWKIGFFAFAVLALFVFVIEPHFRLPYHHVQKWNSYKHFTTLDPQIWKALLKPNPVMYLILMLGPFSFLSLKCKGWLWLLGPAFAFRLLTMFDGLRTTTAHYTGGANALVIISAIYGVVATTSWIHKNRHARMWGWLTPLNNRNFFFLCFIVVAIIFSGKPQLFSIDKFVGQASKIEHQRIVSILKHIPKEYSVLTNERPSAHLTHRPYLFVFFSMFLHTPLEHAARHPDLIVVDEERISDRENSLLSEMVSEGYHEILKSSFISIYERPTTEGLVSQEIIRKWNRINKRPAIPYRYVIRFWYRWIFVLCVVWVTVVLIIRLRRKPLCISS